MCAHIHRFAAKRTDVNATQRDQMETKGGIRSANIYIEAKWKRVLGRKGYKSMREDMKNR